MRWSQIYSVRLIQYSKYYNIYKLLDNSFVAELAFLLPVISDCGENKTTDTFGHSAGV